MSISRFLKSFVLTLALSFLTYAYAPARQVSRPPSEPFKIEKFILKTSDAPAPSQADAFDSETKKTPEATRTSEHYAVHEKVDLNIAQRPLFTRSSRRLTLIDKTYLDVYAILQENNSCSQFFGGPRVATGVLNSLHPRLKKSSLADNPAGINMFGPIINVTDFETGLNYRLFENALVNQTGPFYQSINYQSQGYFHKIGHFSANTREARVSMLLHELGHLMPGSDGRWLLQDDGGDQVQSAANTLIVMNKCSKQIESLSLLRADTPPRLEASTRTESEQPSANAQETARDDSSGNINRDDER
jgi:hypothetical protein